MSRGKRVPAGRDARPAGVIQAEQPPFDTLLEGLRGLTEQDYDGDFVAPSVHATTLARGLVLSAYGSRPDLRGIVPSFSTIGDGSLSMRWRHGDREVRLLVPPSPALPARLYHRSGDEDGVDGAVTGESLAGCVDCVRAR